MAIRCTSGMYNVIVLYLNGRAHSQHILYFLLHFTTHKASINDTSRINLDKTSRVREWKYNLKLSGYYLRYTLQYKIPSKSVQIQLKADNKKTYFLSMASKILSLAEKTALIKKVSLCYLQLLFEILFLRVTVDIAAAISAFVHIKADGCFNQYSTTKYTKDVNHSYILFKCNTFWPIFAHHQVNLHDTPVSVVRSLKVLNMYMAIRRVILNYILTQNVERSFSHQGVHC